MEGGPPIFTHRFTCGVLLAPSCHSFQTRGCHPLWRIFPNAYPNYEQSLMVGLVRVRSPLLTESRLISFPPVTEMFHFTGCRVSFPILFRKEQYHINSIRLPHSEIAGSELICSSPTLIAAYHVLHRLLAPRHPLCALTYLIPLRNLYVCWKPWFPAKCRVTQFLERLIV